MSARLPAALTLSFHELAVHGGGTADNADGWGAAIYGGPDVQVFREPEPAVDSPSVRFLLDHPHPSEMAISHVRRATRGNRALANTHPFRRELGGRMHVFAHNGSFPLPQRPGPLRRSREYRPIGETESEAVFCALLEDLRPSWSSRSDIPPLERRLSIVERFAASLRDLGPANFLYSDSDALFAHADRRDSHDGSGARPPGLHLLARQCEHEPKAVVGARLGKSADESAQRVVLLASVPLSDEAWEPLRPGELVVARRGEIVARLSPGAA